MAPSKLGASTNYAPVGPTSDAVVSTSVGPRRPATANPSPRFPRGVYHLVLRDKFWCQHCFLRARCLWIQMGRTHTGPSWHQKPPSLPSPSSAVRSHSLVSFAEDLRLYVEQLFCMFKTLSLEMTPMDPKHLDLILKVLCSENMGPAAVLVLQCLLDMQQLSGPNQVPSLPLLKSLSTFIE